MLTLTSYLGQNLGFSGEGWVGALVESSTDLKSSHLPMERPQALPISPQNVILCFVPIMKMKIKEIRL